MAKTLYENLVYVPGASTDTISNASTGAANSCVGGDIMDNFKKIANVIHPTSFGNNCISVGGFECYGSGGQSLVTGSYSCNNGYCSIIAGIYCENNKSRTILTGYKAVSTESDSFEVGNDSITYDIRGITGMKHWSGSSAGSLSVDLLTVTLPGSVIVDADVIVYDTDTKYLFTRKLFIVDGALSTGPVSGTEPSMSTFLTSSGTLTYNCASNTSGTLRYSIGIRYTKASGGSGSSYSY